MSTTTNTTTFTFPSGATVSLPAGMAVCQNAGAVTEDVSRYEPAGVTAAGRQVWSHYSCAAYARAADVYAMRAAVAKVRARADELERRGFTIKPANLRAAADRDDAEHDAAIADWTADPAPCGCQPGA
jgi:hypothetical protein